MNQVIIYKQDSGVVAIIRPTEEALALYGIEAIAQKDVPTGKPYEIIDASEIPTDRTFRGAWFHDVSAAAQKVGVDLSKAKNIAHEKRRAKRAEELAPYDEIIAKKIPVKGFDEAEIARALIREKYATIQSFIDAAESVITVREIIDSEGL